VRGSNQHLAAKQSAFHIILEWRARAVQNAIRISTSVRNLLRNRWSRTHRPTNSQHFAIHSFPLPTSRFDLTSSGGGFCAVDVTTFLQLRNGGLQRGLHWQHYPSTARKPTQARNSISMFGPCCPSISTTNFYNHFSQRVSMLKSNIIFRWEPFKNMFRSLNTIKITNPFPSNENYSLEFYNTYSMSHILLTNSIKLCEVWVSHDGENLSSNFPGFNTVCSDVSEEPTRSLSWRWRQPRA